MPSPSRVRTRALTGAALAVLAGLVLAACGGGYGGGGATATTPATTSSAGSAGSVAPGSGATAGTVIRVATVGRFGNVLTDDRGRTLYTFAADDPAKARSACSGACASAWPPLTTTATASAIAAPDGAPGTLAVISRDDGTRQLTYNGWPLYAFSGDRRAGDANGNGVNGFGAVWSVAAVGGPGATPTASGADAGGGYSY